MTNYNDNGVSTISNALKWGGYAALALILFDLVLYVAGMKDAANPNSILQYLGFIIFIGVLVMGIKAYKESNGTMSLGQALGTGTLIGLIAGVLLGIYTWVFVEFIDTSFLEVMKEAQREKVLETGDMTEEQYESMRGMMEMMMSPGALAIMLILMYSFFGFIFSLIAGLVMRNDR